MKPTILALVLLCLPTIAPGADEEPEPVIVRARRRPEPLRSVPGSVTVIDRETIRDDGLRSLADAAPYVPGLHLVEFTARRLSFPFVRGIGSGQGDPAVLTHVDGVPQLLLGTTNLPLLDVDRIEVLRGPRGTLWGRNALGGVIHVITRRPPPTPEVNADATVGSDGLREIRLRGGGPVVDERLLASAAALIRVREGYTTNDRTGHRVDDRDAIFGRIQAVWRPADDHEIRLTLHAERSRDGGLALSDLDGLRDRPHRIDQDFEGVSERDLVAPTLTWAWSGDEAIVTAVASFTTADTLETSDFDFTARDLVRRRSEDSLDAFTSELRVASTETGEIAEGVEIGWLAGAFLLATRSDRSAENELRPDGAGLAFPLAGHDLDRGRFRDLGLGLYAHATLTLGGALDLGAGLRYDREEREADVRSSFTSGGATLSSRSRDLDASDDELLPRFELAWRIVPELTVYGVAARGFKAGGFNLDAPEGRLAFGPESSWTYEAGLHASLLGGRLRLGAAAFHVDWDDMQLSRFDATAGGYVTNAGSATSRGFEIEAAARPVPGLELLATVGSTDATFDAFVDSYGEKADGHRLPFAPETTWSLGARWTLDLGDDLRLRLGGTLHGLGPYPYDAGNQETETVVLANLRAGIGGDGWRVEAWVRNLLDAEYVPLAFQPDPTDPTSFVGESGAPRTFGLTASLRF